MNLLRPMPSKRLQPVRFHSISVFVPGGIHPPLPIHPFYSLAQAQIPVKLDFDPGFRGPSAAATADSRARLEETISRLRGWLSGSPEACGNLPQLLDKIYVHPGGELYVFPSEAYEAQHPVPREWSKWWPGRTPRWVPPVQQLQTDLAPLHFLTRTPVWLDVSSAWSLNDAISPSDKFPFPDKAYQERNGCENLTRTFRRGKGPCVKKIRIGDPYGYRVHPTAEFLNSSSWQHHLHCSHIPVELHGTTIFLELFGAVDDDADHCNSDAKPARQTTTPQDAKREPCHVHCLFRVEQRREARAEAESAAARSKEQDEHTSEDEDESLADVDL